MIADDMIPLVLCGPMVRRVEAGGASVWVALRESATVELALLGADGLVIARGTQATVQAAKRLHVAVVTVGAALAPGTTWHYQLSFETADGRRALGEEGVLGFGAAAGLRALCFGNEARPSFMVPPARREQLRLVHGSCRKPHGKGKDAFGLLAKLVEEGVSQPAVRPQQLFLTGDQIYCDDVPEALLREVMALADWLGGGSDPERAAALAKFDLAALAPNGRTAFVKTHGKYTSDEAANHLVTFLEICAMYLLAWSDVLWPEALARDFPAYASQLPAVRRTLANVATYMMFDDHDVTDDWNRTGRWRKDVDQSAYGQRLIRNALTGYALFQHWGNDPIVFAVPGPGQDFLAAVAAGGVPGEAAGARLEGIEWGYRLESPAHLVVALDTRTQRHYSTETAKPGLMSPAALSRAFAGLPSDARPTVVLSPTPILGLGLIEWVQNWISVFGGDYFDAEAWGFDGTAFDAVIEQLARRKRAVVLSGDVHYGFAATFVGKKAPYKDHHIVNFTSSALLNSGFDQRLAFVLTKIGNTHLQAVEAAGGDRSMVVPEISRVTQVEAADATFEEEVLVSDESSLQTIDGSRRRAAVIGNANFGEVRFEAGHVVQALWYWHEDGESGRYLEHRATLPA